MTILIRKLFPRGIAALTLTLALAACSGEAHDDADHRGDADREKAAEESHGSEDHEAHGSDNHDDHDENEVRQVDSHVHGDALLSMALDGRVLSIELESPLYNLLGFEHAPETPKQTRRLELAEEALSQADNLFRFNTEAGCAALPLARPVKLMGPALKSEEHQDVLLSYKFRCAAPGKLTSMIAVLFNHFPDLTELEMVYLSDTVQLQTELGPFNDYIEFKK